MYNFDKIVNRHNTNSIKWDVADKSFGEKDLLPMWIADMDFECSPAIQKNLIDRVNNHVFGYQTLSDEYYNAVIRWFKKHHNYEAKKDWIVVIENVVVALSTAVKAFTNENDEVIIITPIYSPFYEIVENANRKSVRSSLKKVDGIYTFDFEDLENKVSDKTKAIMICNPHNPIGRVWTKNELEQMSTFCEKHSLIIIDDEIHCDLIFEGEHTISANISNYVANNSVICTSPNKTFNVAGIKVANAIIKNDELRSKFQKTMSKNHIRYMNSFAESVVTAAYTQSEDWFEEMRVYIKGNIDYFYEEVTKITNLKAIKPQGTYLLWLDFSKTGKSADEIKNILIHNCKLLFNDCREYGAEGECCFRVNLACTRSYIKEAINRLKEHFN